MGNSLKGIRLAIVGGDERQLILVNRLLKLGAKIKVLALPARPELVGVQICQEFLEVIENVHAIIFPIPGIDQEGYIKPNLTNKKLRLTKDVFQKIPEHIPIYLGIAQPFFRDWANIYKKKLIEITELDEIAILNSIPTAEGALKIAIEESPTTIHGSNSLVIGFGRCGKTLARMLLALGAKTTVLARKPADLARIKEMGFIPFHYNEIGQILPKADIIFNTVPIKILDEKMLNLVDKEALIIDIATNPGGTDFATAERLGIKAILALGLPGKVAPKTAGLILAQTLPKLILEEISLPTTYNVGGRAK